MAMVWRGFVFIGGPMDTKGGFQYVSGGRPPRFVGKDGKTRVTSRTGLALLRNAESGRRMHGSSTIAACYVMKSFAPPDPEGGPGVVTYEWVDPGGAQAASA
jgi:hypothetical protein